MTHSTGRAVKYITHVCVKTTEVLERHKAPSGEARRQKINPDNWAALDLCKGATSEHFKSTSKGLNTATIALHWFNSQFQRQGLHKETELLKQDKKNIAPCEEGKKKSCLSICPDIIQPRLKLSPLEPLE